MKRILPIILLVSLVATTGCVSKRMAKRGLKFEQAGMYEMAAEMFYQSMVANPKNVDAAVGLKKNGQRLLDEKSLQVHKAYFNGNDKETVYNFIDAQAYHEKVAKTGITLNLSETTKGYYEEAKPRYLESLYTDARILLDEEKFRESEAKFAEIKKIDPSFQGIDEHMKVARAEPIYREGLQFLESGFYRKAYNNFNNIITNHGVYKDSRDLRDDALSKALITISIGQIENRTRHQDANLLVESSVNASLNDLKNPFIQIVDTRRTDQFIDQQVRAISRGTEMQVGQILAAKAILSGAVLRFSRGEGSSTTKEKRGYIREVVTVKDKESGQERKENRYHKVTYTEVFSSNNMNISFQYQLSSTETGAVLVSDALNLSQSDRVNYATFSGDKSKLVPGHWEYSDKDSPKDRIDDNQYALRDLQNLLGARQNLRSLDELQAEVLVDIGKRVAAKINLYNPEE